MDRASMRTMQEGEEEWLEGRTMHSASSAVPGIQDTFNWGIDQSFRRFEHGFDDPAVPQYVFEPTLQPVAPKLVESALSNAGFAQSFCPSDHGLHHLGVLNPVAGQCFYPAAPSFNNVPRSLEGITQNEDPPLSDLQGLAPSYVSYGGYQDPAATVSDIPQGPYNNMAVHQNAYRIPQVSYNYMGLVQHPYSIPIGFNSLTGTHAGAGHTSVPPRNVESVPATYQPIPANSTNPTGYISGTHKQRPTKARSTCQTCNKSFSRPSDLERHAKKHQPGSRVYKCSVANCDYEGSYRKDKLAQHIMNCHK